MSKNQKITVHHKKGEEKGFPEEITALIEKAADSFMTAAEFCEIAKRKCIEHGIDTREVGKRLVEILLKKGKSLRTIQRWLPAEFKAKPRGATVAGASVRKADSESEPSTENEEFSDKNVANESVKPAVDEEKVQAATEKAIGRLKEIGVEKKEPTTEDIRNDPAISQKLKDHLESLPENPNPSKTQRQQQERTQQTAIDFSSTASMLRIIGGIDTDSYNKEYGSLLKASLYQIIELNKTIAQLREQNAEYYRKNSGKSEAAETVAPTKTKAKQPTKQPKQQKQSTTKQVVVEQSDGEKIKAKLQMASDEEFAQYVQYTVIPKGVDSERKWRRHVKEPSFPPNIPKRPDAYYGKRGQWKGWPVLFGKVQPKAKGVEVTATATVEAQA